MNFLRFELFYWLLPVVLAALVIIAVGARRRRTALERLLGRGAEQNKFKLLSPWRRAVRLMLFFGVVLFAFIAAARPYWDEVERPVQNVGRDVLVLFDVSKSMLATDRPPSRFQHGQMIVRELLNDLPGDRFALLPFAGTAIVACPFTPDRHSFNVYLNELNTETIPQGGTNLARALAVAEKAFKSADGDHRVIVLITDGEELSGDSAQAVEELKKKHIPLLIFGIGDGVAGAPIPVRDEAGNTQFVRDEKGNVVYSRLNREMLSRLAAETGGRFFDSTAGNPQVESAVDFIRKLDRRAGNDTRKNLPVERFYIFIALALLLLSLFMLISEYRKMTVMLLFFSFILAAEAETPSESESHDLKLSPATSATAPELYNQARKLQESGDDAAALKLYETLLGSVQGDEITAKVLHNLAVMKHVRLQKELAGVQAALQEQKLPEAEKLLENAVKELSGTRGAYFDSLKFRTGPGTPGGNNLRRLSRDSKLIDELKKMIEELKKLQQQAQDSLDQAQKDNRQQQEQKESPQNQQQPDNQPSANEQQSSGEQESANDQQSSGKQPQPQESQGNPDNSNPPTPDEQPQENPVNSNQSQSAGTDGAQNPESASNEAQQSSKQAQDDLEKLRDQAEKMNQKDLADRAENARKEVEKAREKQQKNDYSGAQQDLENAEKQMGEPQVDQSAQGQDSPPQEQKQSQSAEPSETQSESAREQSNSGQKSPEPPPDRSGNEEAGENEPADSDRQSAEKLLEIMADDELKTRQELQQLRDRMRRPYQVEKDY